GFGVTNLKAQSSTVTPDTVCAGATGEAYQVTNTSGATYHWVITGGTKATGGTTNAITVNWSNTTGTGKVQVVEENASGCFGDTVNLPVFRMPLPTASLSF